jgi:hypothetical protein
MRGVIASTGSRESMKAAEQSHANALTKHFELLKRPERRALRWPLIRVKNRAARCKDYTPASVAVLKYFLARLQRCFLR